MERSKQIDECRSREMQQKLEDKNVIIAGIAKRDVGRFGTKAIALQTVHKYNVLNAASIPMSKE